MIYPIKLSDGSYKFKNSGTIAKYFHALTLLSADTADAAKNPYKYLDVKLINQIFAEENKDGINYQTAFNETYSENEAEQEIKAWLKGWGLDQDQLAKVVEYANGEEVKSRMDKIAEVVDTKIKPKGIPTLIYDGKKHLGLFK